MSPNAPVHKDRGIAVTVHLSSMGAFGAAAAFHLAPAVQYQIGATAAFDPEAGISERREAPAHGVFER